MTPEAARELAARGRLYPSLIVHGGTAETRQELALQLARAVLCESPAESGPCGSCRHCRRMVWSEDDDAPFHPDFRVLRRDLKTSTSVEAAKTFASLCQQTPFEARGQAFVVAEADSLTVEAANALLKTLEEPPIGSPRHFFLLAPSRQDLLPTLRSRSWDVFLGSAVGVDDAAAEELGARLDPLVPDSGRPELLLLASVLEGAGDWSDPRSGQPWALAAAAVRDLVSRRFVGTLRGRQLLDLAEELLDAPQWRLRGIPARRLLEGLAAKHLA